MLRGRSCLLTKLPLVPILQTPFNAARGVPAWTVVAVVRTANADFANTIVVLTASRIAMRKQCVVSTPRVAQKSVD